MFTLTLHDRNGATLNQGDIVKVSNGRGFTFYSEVKYLEKEKIIAPFHTFSFHSFEKVDKVPDNAIPSSEERYKIWYMKDNESEIDESPGDFERYLMDWRCCEHLLEKRIYRIELNEA